MDFRGFNLKRIAVKMWKRVSVSQNIKNPEFNYSDSSLILQYPRFYLQSGVTKEVHPWFAPKGKFFNFDPLDSLKRPYFSFGPEMRQNSQINNGN